MNIWKKIKDFMYPPIPERTHYDMAIRCNNCHAENVVFIEMGQPFKVPTDKRCWRCNNFLAPSAHEETL